MAARPRTVTVVLLMVVSVSALAPDRPDEDLTSGMHNGRAWNKLSVRERPVFLIGFDGRLEPKARN